MLPIGSSSRRLLNQSTHSSVILRHKPIRKDILEPFRLRQGSGRNGGQFNFGSAALGMRLLEGCSPSHISLRDPLAGSCCRRGHPRWRPDDFAPEATGCESPEDTFSRRGMFPTNQRHVMGWRAGKAYEHAQREDDLDWRRRMVPRAGRPLLDLCFGAASAAGCLLDNPDWSESECPP